MMRISDTVYYKVIKDTDLAEASLDDALELLWESSREGVVSIAVFSGDGELIAAAPLQELKNSVTPEPGVLVCRGGRAD